MFGTLRFRLTVWNTAVVLLMALVTLWGSREGLRLILWQEADSQLVEDAREIQDTYEQLYPDVGAIRDEFTLKAKSHKHRGLHIRIFDADNKVDWTSPNAPPVAFPTRFFSSGLTPVTAGHYRLVHVRPSKPGMPPVTIRIGTSFEPLEADVAQISQLLVLVGVVALLISPLGGYWLAGRATRPIAQIIDTTNRLHPTSLGERLALRGTRDELDRLSETINGFLDRIAIYIEQNREFTANAAHELRSPLAAIQSSLEVALNSDRSVDEYKELLADVLDECEALRVLVNQLLLLSESDAGCAPAGREPVQFDLIVARACDMFLGVAETAGVTLLVKQLDACPVMGDAGRLRQVVNNLIDNAIKYTRAGGQVTVRLIADIPGRAVHLVVQDTGVGIPPADLPHVFDRFFRGDKARPRGRLGRGTGLGLAICRSIVAGHQGQITVDSTVNRGTTMTVDLPMATESPPRVAPESSSEPFSVASMAEHLD